MCSGSQLADQEGPQKSVWEALGLRGLPQMLSHSLGRSPVLFALRSALLAPAAPGSRVSLSTAGIKTESSFLEKTPARRDEIHGPDGSVTTGDDRGFSGDK
ncbi:hypothetical protein GHT09_008755 [Marmota monax]|uniref:Uncharacterized protein n=1 Tax=Marmota monax TaxID=9995 RepID=A0A834PNZ4_MARMO|nr:hypothetical protein GHT09_008755 [Marmota monax]